MQEFFLCLYLVVTSRVARMPWSVRDIGVPHPARKSGLQGGSKFFFGRSECAKKKKTRKRFAEEFKAETVKLVEQSNRSIAERFFQG
jgi:hypothetical protein